MVSENLENCVNSFSTGIKPFYSGKVRESYEIDDGSFALVTTDRQSAFDRILASVPFKGQVLNLTSAWWFEKTHHIVESHLLSIPDPNVSLVKRCKPFPVEFVVRGYITGSSNTSLWVNYAKGIRKYCGIDFPDGLNKNQKLENVVITPTTKSDEGDVPISPEEIVDQGLMTQSHWDYCSAKAVELFKYGQHEAEKKGFILVDTKYEMGLSAEGEVLLIDELHSPDSSRYWRLNSYETRYNEGKEPENIDKEFLRLWFKDNCDPYKDEKLPEAPTELIVELALRYIQIYEELTGSNFDFPSRNEDVNLRVSNVLKDLGGREKGQ
ncbi:MAG: phosphoribosylaminoimidazolesuccinocarboxamide synthase [Verrucomicrobiota bacterium]|nr:phosphoribosylaminoimidazolesuccinocarboxamide synthase [Verrucomicrobiota bacterium]